MSRETSPIFGRLEWTVTPYTDLLRDVNSSTIVGAGAASVLVLGAIAGVALLTYRRLFNAHHQLERQAIAAKKVL